MSDFPDVEVIERDPAPDGRPQLDIVFRTAAQADEAIQMLLAAGEGSGIDATKLGKVEAGTSASDLQSHGRLAGTRRLHQPPERR